MGNYNTICKIEECKTKVRTFATDAYYCENHTCHKFYCNDRKVNILYCSYHSGIPLK